MFGNLLATCSESLHRNQKTSGTLPTTLEPSNSPQVVGQRSKQLWGNLSAKAAFVAWRLLVRRGVLTIVGASSDVEIGGLAVLVPFLLVVAR